MNRLAPASLALASLIVAGCNGNAKPQAVAETTPKTEREIKKTMIKEGTGNPLLEGDTVYIEYIVRSATEDFVFDRNDEVKDETGPNLPPYFFKIGSDQTTKGLNQAILNSKVGDEFDVFVPWELAYGEQGLQVLNIPGKQDIEYHVRVLGGLRVGEEFVYDSVDKVVGTGQALESGDLVVFHYRGTYLNGKRFDDSRERGDVKAGGTPLETKLGANRIIKGLDVGMVGMKRGGKRVFTFPPLLVYGDGGYGAIMGGQMTVFEVELLDIK